jgi:hypothetical protein
VCIGKDTASSEKPQNLSFIYAKKTEMFYSLITIKYP